MIGDQQIGAEFAVARFIHLPLIQR